MKRTTRSLIMSSVAASAIFTGWLAAPAMAQEDGASEQVEEVVVTGTRIRRPNLKSASPITTVDAEEVRLQGATGVDSFLAKLPQIEAGNNENQSNNSDGTAGVNLRSLGGNRALVLIDGQRFLPTMATDLNFIPAALIERTDVLTGGASSVYGSDAMSGVVNFILKKNLTGVRVDAQYSIYNHQNDDSYLRGVNTAAGNKLPDSSVWDGAKTDVNIAAGANFEDGKGNITGYFGYRKMDAVRQDARDFSNCALNFTSDPTNSAFQCGGSSTHAYGYFRPTDASVSGAANINRNWANSKDGTKTWVPNDASFNYNYAPSNYLQRNSERYSAGAFLNYNFNKHAELYGSVMFMDDHSFSQVAPSAIWGGRPFKINCDNPFMSAQQGAILCGAAYGTSVDATAQVAFRAATGEPRRNDMRHTDYRVAFGVRGEINEAFRYDMSYMYALMLSRASYQNDINQNKAENALKAVMVDGTIVCRDTAAPCAPIDVFSAKGPSAAGYNYIYSPTFTKSDQDIKSFNAFISGDLGVYGVTSPWATDGLAMVLGVEHREETLDTRFDQVQKDAGSVDADGVVTVKEIFTEFDLPLIQEKPFIYSLAASFGYRTSKYEVSSSTSTGSEKDAETYKVELRYSPTPDVLLRASYNKAMRAANISELFAAQGVGNAGFVDPCSETNLTKAGKPTAEQCARTGVTALQYFDPSRGGGTIADCPADVCTALGGGNPNLDPETGKTQTYGIVFTPRNMRNLSVSLDYFKIRIEDYIGSIDANVSFSQCLTTGDPFYCSLIKRASDGAVWGYNIQGGHVVATNINTGYLETKGFDLTGSYVLDTESVFGKSYGSVNFAFVGTLLDSLETEVLPGLGSYDCKGLFGGTCGQPAPEWRHSLRATWIPAWEAAWAPSSVSLNWRHIGEVGLSRNTDNEYLTGTPSAINAKIGSYDYIDLAVTYKLPYVDLRAGINNVFDKSPPAIQDGLLVEYGNGNTYPGTYDALGRMVFVGLSAKF